MIHPNMGTMLAFLTTDAAVEKDCLKETLSRVTDRTFNRVTVDGDTSRATWPYSWRTAPRATSRLPSTRLTIRSS